MLTLKSGRRILIPLLFALSSCAALSCGDEQGIADASDKVKAFDKFVLVWPGEQWDQDEDGNPETPITSAKEFRTPPGRLSPGTHGFEIVYGTCEIPPGQTEGGCPVPLHVVIYPPCETPVLAEEAKVAKVKVRGVDASVTAGAAVWIETEDFTVQITHAGPLDDSQSENHVDKALKLAQKLTGANDKAKHIKRDTEFKPKATDFCSPS